MLESKLNITLGLAALALGLLLVLFFMNVNSGPELPPESAVGSTANQETVTSVSSKKVQQPSTEAGPPLSSTSTTAQKPPQTDGPISRVKGNKEYPSEGSDLVEIDPAHLKQAQDELDKNRRYEAEARATLPTLSIQTHNPVWALEYDMSRQKEELGRIGGVANAAAEGEPKQGPQPAPESGEFGKIQPPPGEIWLRIPAGNSFEHRDIMAQNADLYRAETGYSGPVTITIWVGGRPYARQQYE